MTSIAIPSSVAGKRRISWGLVLALALAASVVAAIIWLSLSWRWRGTTDTGVYYTVTPMAMEVTLTKDGELNAVNNLDITCPVEGQSTIQYIVKEGTIVKKGDVLIVIDSSELQTKLENATLDLQKAEADLTAAKEAKEIQESTNLANLEASNVELILARLDLQQYQEGTYPQQLDEAKRNLEMAKISVKTKEQDLAQKQGLFGKGFVNSADVKKAEIELMTAQNDLAKKETDLLVLDKYTHEKDLTDKRNKVAQAEKKFTRTQRENASNLAQKVADLQAKEQALVLRKRQYDNVKQQLDSCTIKAPGDGLVVYGSSGSSYGWGRRDTPIQAGATVRYQEVVIRLPDTSQMKAVTRIQEAQVPKLRVDPDKPMRASVKITGVPEPVSGWVSNISVMADSSARWWGSDVKEYPVDITLDQTPVNLKPGIGVTCTIFVDRLNSALAVPLASLYTVGKESYVFVRDRGAEAPRPVKVKVGQVNDTHAQVVEGITSGQQVMLLAAGQGRDLLERAGIKLEASASTQPADEELPPIGPNGPGGEVRESHQRAESAAPSGDSSSADKADSSRRNGNSNGQRRSRSNNAKPSAATQPAGA